MEWSEAYSQQSEPTFNDIDTFIHNRFWQDINTFLQDTYGLEPKKEYSGCGM